MKNLNVLIVDDDRDVLDTIKLVLQECNIDCVENGKKALGMLEAFQFDLIITDCEMPVMDGFELVKKIRGMRINTSIFMITGNVLEKIKPYYKQGLIQGFFKKPFDVNFFKNTLSCIIEMLRQR